MSTRQIPIPVDTIDICKVFRVKKEDTTDTIDEMLSKYSEFARGKNIVYKTQLGSGSFGFVFLVKISTVSKDINLFPCNGIDCFFLIFSIEVWPK